MTKNANRIIVEKHREGVRHAINSIVLVLENIFQLLRLCLTIRACAVDAVAATAATDAAVVRVLLMANES